MEAIGGIIKRLNLPCTKCKGAEVKNCMIGVCKGCGQLFDMCQCPDRNGGSAEASEVTRMLLDLRNEKTRVGGAGE